MSSDPLGIGPSGVEVTSLSAHGVRLLAGERELLMPYARFPWVKEAPVSKILDVEEPTPGYFHRPDLDVNPGIDAIEHPERSPSSPGAASRAP